MLANLRALFAVVIDIVLLRRGPEQLPASPLLLAISVGLYCVIAATVASTMGTADSRLPLEMAVIVSATLLWYRAALQIVKKPERFVQTATAMFATRALIAPLDLPVRLTVFTQVQAGTQPSSVLALLFLFLLVWQFVINVRIVRAAFEWPLAGAIVMIIAQEFAVLLVVASLFGNAPAPTP
jgi:hypothetical protein